VLLPPHAATPSSSLFLGALDLCVLARECVVTKEHFFISAGTETLRDFRYMAPEVLTQKKGHYTEKVHTTIARAHGLMY
jgi:hypothetical protein